MEKAFKIVFDLNLDGSSSVLQLEAMVELKNSAPHYTIKKIGRKGQDGSSGLLPDVDIKCVLSNGEYKWVHTDSGKETNLSNAIGAAIASTKGNPQIADHDEDGGPEDEI
jgi:hypothetical protein